jgi:hypothetical protein
MTTFWKDEVLIKFSSFIPLYRRLGLLHGIIGVIFVLTDNSDMSICIAASMHTNRKPNLGCIGVR